MSARPKRKAPATAKTQGAFENQQQRADFTKPICFLGTDNPRALRVITVLMRRPISREEFDAVAGCANGPDLASSLRDLGLTLDCKRIRFIDRDGRPCNPGVYSFDASDRRKVRQWQAKRQQGAADA